jgi:hypothetical protein
MFEIIKHPLIPANAGTQITRAVDGVTHRFQLKTQRCFSIWVPAFAGMSGF